MIGNPSLNHRYRKGFYSLFKTLQQNPTEFSKEVSFNQLKFKPFFLKKAAKSFQKN
ncbi:hypothetical protein SS1_00975 [Enterococcus faecium EnGen0187]|nr:hypothetical protein SE3_02223 [Enterococcus faecium EnGen0124]EOF76642.1 hypothetical protein SGG_02557 [Enterococcus faecium EnGen0138]EOF96773.1 hypothetical protein SKK_01817 [Enterococcus faecium EnGen0168]EOH42015.1 hypothetical protein SSC_02095 [Enterococcus faecium EnGen0189]EOL00608.1 hypothetical protein SIS_02372 [Enterococcus faecium EnGen0156]EOM60814.1 hypothetical protein SS1_00975 [Enterococcus faecium EnGen0187]